MVIKDATPLTLGHYYKVANSRHHNETESFGAVCELVYKPEARVE